MIAKILSIKGKVFEGEVLSANLKTQTGEITILDNHRPLVTLLVQGEAILKNKNGKEERVLVNSGFLEMSKGNVLTLLIE